MKIDNFDNFEAQEIIDTLQASLAFPDHYDQENLSDSQKIIISHLTSAIGKLQVGINTAGTPKLSGQVDIPAIDFSLAELVEVNRELAYYAWIGSSTNLPHILHLLAQAISEALHS